MIKVKRMSVFQKLLIYAVLSSLIVISLSIYTTKSLKLMEKHLENTYHNSLKPLEEWGQFGLSISKIKTLFNNHLVAMDIKKMDEIEKQINFQLESAARIFKNIKISKSEIQKLLTERKMHDHEVDHACIDLSLETEERVFALMKYHFDLLINIKNTGINYSKNLKKEDAAKIFFTNEGLEILQILDNVNTLFYSKMGKQFKNEIDKSHKNGRKIAFNNYIGCSIAIIVSLFIGYLISISISKAIKNVVNGLKDIAEGESNLSMRLSVDSKDEIGELSQWFNVFIEKLQSVISEIADGVETLASSADSISSSIREQITFASQQSASISEITGSVSELSATSNQIAENADVVAKTADRSFLSTKEGADSVELVKKMMHTINADNKKKTDEIVTLGKKSKEITGVMEIINNISDQTKLIAFNAALEASGAGESGKRFGVVAAEIRRLAENVMVSTRETEVKINEIQEAVNYMIIDSERNTKKIQEALEAATKTSSKLEDIVLGAKSTAEAAKMISSSTQQQKTASTQCINALREIDEGGKQTTKSINSIGSIASDLTTLSKGLRKTVKKFKLM